jgi:hypothetical protein
MDKANRSVVFRKLEADTLKSESALLEATEAVIIAVLKDAKQQETESGREYPPEMWNNFAAEFRQVVTSAREQRKPKLIPLPDVEASTHSETQKIFRHAKLSFNPPALTLSICFVMQFS